MNLVDTLREILKTEYGINGLVDLDAAIKKLEPVQIGMFVTRKKEETANEHLKYGLQESA